MVGLMLSTLHVRGGHARPALSTPRLMLPPSARNGACRGGSQVCSLHHRKRAPRTALRSLLLAHQPRCCAANAASSITPGITDSTIRNGVLIEIAAIGLPILGAALSEPLLTLVDTVAIGQFGAPGFCFGCLGFTGSPRVARPWRMAARCGTDAPSGSAIRKLRIL